MDEIACPYCTFLNPCTKMKCGMCLKLLRKRERCADDTKPCTETGKRERQESPASPSPETTVKLGGSETPLLANLPIEKECSPASPASSSGSTPASVPASPASALVPTFFATASGKAVTVRRGSLLTAAKRFGDQDAPDTEVCGPALLGSPGDRTTKFRRTMPEEANAVRAGTSTLATDLQSVDTLFATASGTPVRVSVASMRKAAEVLGVDTATETAALANSENSATTAPHISAASSSSLPSQVRESSGEMANSGSTVAERVPPVPEAFAMGRRRRGFVPPQQRHPSQPPTSASLPATVVRPMQRTSLPLLRLDPRVCDSGVVAPAPSLQDTASHAYTFTGMQCGPVLAASLGVKDSEAVQPLHWHALLLKLGASAKHCTLAWCQHALVSAMMRMCLADDASLGQGPHSLFSATSVLLCLMLLYNTEMVNGERPALRKMVEGDISCASLAILYLSSVREERTAPHMRIVTLSDGVYHLRATCDVPLSNLIREGVLRPGQKMAVCGAKSLLHGHCSPTECGDQVALSVNFNCVRAVAALTPLGVCRGEPRPLPLSHVHPHGGLVPAIEGVVARVLPPFYISQGTEELPPLTSHGGCATRERTVRTVRCAHAQLQRVDRLQRGLVEGKMYGEEGGEAQQLSRITSLLLVNNGAEALVQQWETIEERSLLSDEDSATSLPVEGSWATLYAVNPAKSRTAAAPFSRAKLFFSSRRLHYAPSKRPLQRMRAIWCNTADLRSTIGMGDVADVGGLFVGSHRNGEGTFALVLMRDDTYALLQIPLASPSRCLSLPLPSSEQVPVVLLNMTFLTAEDPTAGSDCCRFFANEYTVLLQRSTQPDLVEVLDGAARLQTLMEGAPQKHTARKTEIFRSLDEALSSGGGVASPTAVSDIGREARMSVEMPAHDGADVAPLLATTAARRPTGVAGTSLPPQEARLPYYLREGNGKAINKKLQGVRIPALHPTTALPASTKIIPTHDRAGREEMPPRSSGAGPLELSRHYGNPLDLIFLYDPKLQRRAWHPLHDPLLGSGDAPRDAATAAAQPTTIPFQRAQLCWRVSSNSADDIVCQITDRKKFCEFMESVCPLQDLCFTVGDTGHIDVSLLRSERVKLWRRADASTVWWRFFTDSRLLSNAADVENASVGQLWWLSQEWMETMQIVQGKLRAAFFFFCLRGDELRHLQLISSSCDVSALPYD